MKNEFLFAELAEFLLPQRSDQRSQPRFPKHADRSKNDAPLREEARRLPRPVPFAPRFKTRGRDGELRIKKENLTRIIGLAEMALPRKSAIPAARMVRLDSHDKSVTASCTDLTVHVNEDLNAGGKGSFLLEPFVLRRLLKTRALAFRFGLTGQEIEVECAGKDHVQREVLTQGNPDDLPARINPPRSFRKVQGLALALRESSRFCAREQVRENLAGIHLSGDDVVSSDGKRLYLRTVDTLGFDPPATIPNSRLFESKRHMSEDLSIARSKKRAWLRTGWWTLSLPLLEVSFPNYVEILPKKRPINRWRISNGEVSRLQKILPTLPFDKEEPAIRLVFEKNGHGARLRLVSATDERSGAVLDRIDYQGASGSLRANPVYLFDLVGVHGIELFCWSEPSSVIAAYGKGLVSLLMPLTDPRSIPRK